MPSSHEEKSACYASHHRRQEGGGSAACTGRPYATAAAGAEEERESQCEGHPEVGGRVSLALSIHDGCAFETGLRSLKPRHRGSPQGQGGCGWSCCSPLLHHSPLAAAAVAACSAACLAALGLDSG